MTALAPLYGAAAAARNIRVTSMVPGLGGLHFFTLRADTAAPGPSGEAPVGGERQERLLWGAPKAEESFKAGKSAWLGCFPLSFSLLPLRGGGASWVLISYFAGC